MPAMRLLPREEWSAELRRLGCQPLEGKGKLNTAEWWRVGGHLFTVPLETADGRIGQADFERLLARLRPNLPN
jgi:hypothetical protein